MKLLHRLQSFQQENFLCDAVIVSNTLTEYKVHSIILAAVSPIFEEAFRSSPSSGVRYVNLPSIDDETMLVLVNLIYSGKFLIPNISTKLDISNRIETIILSLKELGIDKSSFDATENIDFNDENLDGNLKIELPETNEQFINEDLISMTPSLLLCKYCNLPFDSLENLSLHNCLKANAVNTSKAKKLKRKIQIKKKIKTKSTENTTDNLGIILLQENRKYNSNFSNLKSYSNLKNMRCKKKNSNESKPISDLETDNDFKPSKGCKAKNSIPEIEIQDLLAEPNNDTNIISNSVDNFDLNPSQNFTQSSQYSNRKTHLPNYLSDYISEYETHNFSVIDENSQDGDDYINKISRNTKNTSYKLSNERDNYERDNYSLEKNYSNTDLEWDEKYDRRESFIGKSGKKMVVCELCGLRLKKYSLTSHMETMHQRDNSKYPCTECDLVFHTGHRRHMHVIKEHKKIPYGHLCELCGRSFDNNTSIYYHMYKHKKEEEDAAIKKIIMVGMKAKKEKSTDCDSG